MKRCLICGNQGAQQLPCGHAICTPCHHAQRNVCSRCMGGSKQQQQQQHLRLNKTSPVDSLNPKNYNYKM